MMMMAMTILPHPLRSEKGNSIPLVDISVEMYSHQHNTHLSANVRIESAVHHFTN